MNLFRNTDEEYDGLPPEPFDQAAHDRALDHAVRFDHVQSLLEEAVAGENVSEAAGHAIAMIRNAAFNRNTSRLNTSERDELLDLLVGAREKIFSCLGDRLGRNSPNPKMQAFASAAFGASCALIVLWAEEDPKSNRSRELCSDLEDYTRWLRNELHNVSIEADIQRRQAARVQLIVDQIKEAANSQRLM
ncbi:hypothetical protein [Oryzifoliimicrobium ureilyticus]|uniref:hypothetical protein n=1 Tax=Oryzifoliimicrobium ureilyticus TaxID=3113724 RepID=UPI003076493C